MDTEHARLRWRCRRGMRELDLVMGGYLDQHYALADDRRRAAFRRILELPDPQIFSYLTGREEPSDADIAAVVHVMRAFRDAGSRA